jgi:hypothetical protein
VSREDETAVTRCIDALLAGEPSGLLKTMMLSSRVAEPKLRKVFGAEHHENRKLSLAKALAWFGNKAGNDLILDEMRSLFRQEQATGALPREYYREDKDSHYWSINQDIALLALSGDATVLSEILALADSLPLGHPPVKQATIYNQGRIDLRLVPYYNRIVIICFAIERMPHASAVPTLNRLLDGAYIRNHVSRMPGEAGERVYGGILESRLAATLARCGAKRGFMVLAEYLHDVHPMLAHYAGQELASILGEDHGFDSRRWKEHIHRLKFPREPVPCQRDVVEL